MPSSVTSRADLVGESLTLIPRKRTSRPWDSCMVWRSGISSRHGVHQVAHRLTTIGLPSMATRSARVVVDPSHSSNAIVVTGSPEAAPVPPSDEPQPPRMTDPARMAPLSRRVTTPDRSRSPDWCPRAGARPGVTPARASGDPCVTAPPVRWGVGPAELRPLEGRFRPRAVPVGGARVSAPPGAGLRGAAPWRVVLDAAWWSGCVRCGRAARPTRPMARHA